jgi:uncharacterized protein (TIGR00375 family)
VKIVADLHVHSRYSISTSREMVLPCMALWAEKKGVDLLGTGDFTHPEHFSEIRKLKDDGSGLFKLQKRNATRFIISGEVSVIFKRGGRTRKQHIILLVPGIKETEKLNRALGKKGKVASNGRPVFKMDAKDMLLEALSVSEHIAAIPAHAWTPWFSIFGSNSGFDSIEECYGELSKHIFAIETGLSSDPAMCRRVSALDKISLVSNSDAHSPMKIGREANVLECEPTFSGVVDAIRSRDPKKFLYTIEFFPEQGKYHNDGHRDCGVNLDPAEAMAGGGICPKCRKMLTAGVLHRVEELADRKFGTKSTCRIPFRNLVPLETVIAWSLGKKENSPYVKRAWDGIISSLGNELSVLLDMGREELVKSAGEKIADAVLKVREGRVRVTPGYDGEYGKIDLK